MGSRTVSNILTLKWGTVKAWELKSDEAKAALQKWVDYGVSMSAMAQKDSPEQMQALLDAIDFMDEIYLDWEGKFVSKDEAKEYVRNYGKSIPTQDQGANQDEHIKA